MISRERHYLLDILLAAEDILCHVRGFTFETFLTNELIQDAVMYRFIVLGEAAGRITDASAAEVPDLPWRKMKNVRNFLAHEYEDVNMPIIWGIVTDELPKVIAALDGLFPERKSR